MRSPAMVSSAPQSEAPRSPSPSRAGDEAAFLSPTAVQSPVTMPQGVGMRKSEVRSMTLTSYTVGKI